MSVDVLQTPAKAPGFDGATFAEIMDRPGRACMFPLWGHAERFDVKTSCYCGAPAAEAAPYCGFHCEVATGTGTPGERGAVRDARYLAKRFG